MIKVFCNIADALVDPLFEVFDGGDFILSSYHDIEETDTQMQVYLADPAQAGEAARRLKDALARLAGTPFGDTATVAFMQGEHQEHPLRATVANSLF